MLFHIIRRRLQKGFSKRYRFTPDAIRRAIWLYAHFALNLRDAREPLAQRDPDTSFETERRRVLTFAQPIALYNTFNSTRRLYNRLHFKVLEAPCCSSEIQTAARKQNFPPICDFTFAARRIYLMLLVRFRGASLNQLFDTLAEWEECLKHTSLYQSDDTPSP